MALIRTGLKKLARMLLALSADNPPPAAGPNPNPSQPFGKMRNAPTVMAGSIQLLGMAEIKQRLPVPRHLRRARASVLVRDHLSTIKIAFVSTLIQNYHNTICRIQLIVRQ